MGVAQALDLIKVLQASKTLPIARARMRVRITMPAKDGKRLKEKILPLVSTVEDDEWGDEWELVRRTWRVSLLREGKANFVATFPRSG